MIAICVPCWNQVAYTKSMVESVLRNSYGHDVRFFFVDNGSSDGTWDYLNSLTHRAPVIRNPDNVGVNPAWNQLLDAALKEGPSVVCLANNDILAGPGWLDPVARELGKGDLRYFLPNGGFTDDRTFEADVRERVKAEAGKTRPGRAGWCLFFRPESVRLFLPIPPRLKLWFGDDYIHWVLGNRGYRCEVLMDCCCFHYVSKSVAQFPDMVRVVEEDRRAFREITGIHVP